MNLYIIYRPDPKSFQLAKVTTNVCLWYVTQTIPEAIYPYTVNIDPLKTDFMTIEERINFITDKHNTVYNYYGPFNSIEDLSHFFTNTHPELLI